MTDNMSSQAKLNLKYNYTQNTSNNYRKILDAKDGH